MGRGRQEKKSSRKGEVGGREEKGKVWEKWEVKRGKWSRRGEVGSGKRKM